MTTRTATLHVIWRMTFSALALSLGVEIAPAAFQASPIVLVSASATGVPGDLGAAYPSVSRDGRYVAFQTNARNFDLSDDNNSYDVYRKDLQTGAIVRVSKMPDGSAGVGGGGDATISADGRIVKYSTIDPHVPGDTGAGDIYVRDMQTDVVVRASVTHLGGQANGNSAPSTMSGDGRVVAFVSLATNLIPVDLNGGSYTTGRDVFVRDLEAGVTELVHVSTGGVQGNSSAQHVAISFDGRFVGFNSGASNLVPNDTNAFPDIFVRDRALGTTTRINLGPGRVQANGLTFSLNMSSDARFVTFYSVASNLVAGDHNNSGPILVVSDAFLHDRQTGRIELLSIASNGRQGDSGSHLPSISDDGRYATFETLASNLLPGSTGYNGKICVRDRVLGTTRRVDVTPSGGQPDTYAIGDSVISADGSSIVFTSQAQNLIPHTGNTLDVFLARHHEQSPINYCTATATSSGCTPSMHASGTPSASQASGFVLSAVDLDPDRFATVLYGTQGPSALPMPGGTLCVGAQPRRTALLRSQGQGPCGGALSYDFNAWIASTADATLVTSQGVWAQFWSRDPLSTRHLNLTDAVFFILEP